jgi:acyl-CoA dehydrogenase
MSSTLGSRHGQHEILAEYGSEEAKDRWLEPLLNGHTPSCFSMTEPQTAGSDPTGLAARAELDGGEWVINGHSGSPRLQRRRVAIAMVVTDPDAAPAQAREHDPRAHRHPRASPACGPCR